MRRIDWTSLDEAQRLDALARPAERRGRALKKQVEAIIADVASGGWDALCRHARVIDGAEPEAVPVAPAAREARASLGEEAIEAIELACRNIRAFHQESLPLEVSVETMAGLTVRKVWRPIDRVGIYVPGGKTPLFSSLLMLAVPAQVAGVREIVCVTPPRRDGGIDPAIALAAELSGIESIWTVGGAQAIAALAHGAGAIPRVDKICGPGNAWVAEAKAQIAACGAPAIDMPAGPSELLVIADDSADPRLVAADLLSQAEHDANAQVMLVGIGEAIVTATLGEIERQLGSLSRSAIAGESLANGKAIVAGSLADALAIANAYAPEHLTLAIADPEPWVAEVRNAGALFVGHAAAESFGDYLAGSSHVLPTDGAARAHGGISTHSFMKAMTVQTLGRDAAARLARTAATLARLEGLEAHARAAELRGEAA